MTDYQLASVDENGPVIRTADGANIPADPANRDWMEYQDWLTAGNKPDPYVHVPPPLPPPDANARLDAGIAGAQDVMANPPAVPKISHQPPSAAEFAALQAQVDQLQEAVKAMLIGHSRAPEPHT